MENPLTAREGATDKLADGTVVEVDGSRGSVTVVG